MYASSDPLAGGGFADHGVFLAAASPLRYAIPKYVEAKHHAPLAISSRFSNAKANASREDIAMGLIWMVLQSIYAPTG